MMAADPTFDRASTTVSWVRYITSRVFGRPYYDTVLPSLSCSGGTRLVFVTWEPCLVGRL
jgi:hypothetical protein